MTDYQQLAQEIRAKRQYRETEDGTVFCSLAGCAGSTGLRCQRTSVPICKKCAVKTPVGYISREAAHAQQDVFFNAATKDYLLAFGTAFMMNLVIGFLATRVLGGLGFFFGLILIAVLGTAIAGAISEAVWRAVEKRRGRYMGRVVTLALILSSLLFLLGANLLLWLAYVFVIVTAVNARFQMGIRLY
jgi:hypothetical protein